MITTKQCPKCPMAKIFWRELKDEYKFDYEELDSASEKGQIHVGNFSIMSIPTAIVEVDGKEPVLFIGTPSRKRALEAIIG